jgi:hypothetical protein
MVQKSHQHSLYVMTPTSYSYEEICPKVGDAPRQAAFGTCLIPSLNTGPLNDLWQTVWPGDFAPLLPG